VIEGNFRWQVFCEHINEPFGSSKHGEFHASWRNHLTSPIKLPTAADTTRGVISDVREFRITEIFCLRTSLPVYLYLVERSAQDWQVNSDFRNHCIRNHRMSSVSNTRFLMLKYCCNVPTPTASCPLDGLCRRRAWNAVACKDILG